MTKVECGMMEGGRTMDEGRTEKIGILPVLMKDDRRGPNADYGLMLMLVNKNPHVILIVGAASARIPV